jgi:hypothetical protein
MLCADEDEGGPSMDELLALCSTVFLVALQ